MEQYVRPPRPGMTPSPHPSIEEQPVQGNPDVAPDIPLPQSTAEGTASDGRLGKLGGRFKGIFSRGKKDANAPSKKDMEEGTPPTSKTSTPVADTGSHTELLSSSKDESRFGRMRGRMKNIFSRGKKDDSTPAPPPTGDVTSEAESGKAPPASSFDTSRKLSADTYSTHPETKSPPSDKSTTLQSIKAFVRSPPKEEDKHPTWKKSKPKPICRSSNVLNVLLVLLVIAGIIMTALSSHNQVLRVIGPICLGLSALALIGKIFFTLYFQDDPFPRLRPVVERISHKIMKKKAAAAPPPSVQDIGGHGGRVNLSTTPEAIQMEEVYPAKGMNIANEALRTSTPTLQMDRSRTPDNMYSDYPREPGYNRSRTPDLPYAPPQSRAPDFEVPYYGSSTINYERKQDIGDLKPRYI